MSFVLDILEFEPKPLAEIVHKLAEFGIISNLDSPSDDLSQILGESDAIWGSASGLFARTDKMLEGACLTHRLTSTEIENNLVDIVPDLDGIGFNLQRIMISRNRELQLVFRDLDHVAAASDHGSFLGPEGWLSEYDPGDIIAFRRTGSSFSIFRPRELYRGDEERVALLRAFNNLYNDGRGVEPMEILLDSICENPALFRYPVPPIQELTQSLLLEPRGIWLGPVAEDWNPPDEAWQIEKKKKLADSLGFDRCCTKEFEFALAAWKKWRKSKRTNLDYKGVLNALAHGDVAVGFTSWVFQFETFPHRSIEAFTTDLVASGGAKAAAGYYVRAISRSLEGKALLAERDLRTAINHDPTFEPAKVELANCLADRGDINGYIAALRLCKPSSVLSELYEAQALLPIYPLADRNETCPCGSGLKYKACCQKSPKFTTKTRIRWLQQRVMRWISRPERQENLSDYFLSFNETLSEPADENYSDFIYDVAIFEGRGIEEYMDLRRELISPVDRQLLERLSSSRRTLLEVIQVDLGRSLTLRDTLTGEEKLVFEALGSLDSRIGDYLMGRVIDTEEGSMLAGHSMRILLRQRDGFLDLLRNSPEPFDLVGWLASSIQRVEILNFAVEEIVFYKAVIEPGDLPSLSTALFDEFGPDRGGRWIASESDGGDITNGVAMVSLQDGLVAIEASSQASLQRTLDRLQGLSEKFVVLDTTHHSIVSTTENFTGHVDIEGLDGLDENAKRVIDAHVEILENRWIDQAIPALGGLTPKQAMSDPTRREDLARLMNEFERNELRALEERRSRPVGFQAARIRGKLGLR